jgi:hypothetical protein
MTEKRTLAGDVEGARDPAKEAKRGALDDEKAKPAKDSKERARDSSLAAAGNRSGYT